MTGQDPVAGVEDAVEASAGGVVLRVRAQPGARRNGITGLREGELVVAVTAAPDKGRANAALTKLLAKALGVAKGNVELVGGLANRRKRFAVQGLTRPAALARLSEALDPTP